MPVNFGHARSFRRAVTKTRVHRVFLKTAFWAWAVALFVLATSLTAAHFYVLPKPGKTDVALERSLNGLRSPGDRRGWLAVHVLYAQCRCSRGILSHLASTARPHQVREKVLLVGANPEIAPLLTELAARGIQVVNTSAAELRDRYHVQAAPLLLVSGPDGALRYSGGYTERKQGQLIRDLEVMQELVQNHEPPELPVFGCAVSRQLQQLLDPLALKARSP
jgi:hypothetical protein